MNDLFRKACEQLENLKHGSLKYIPQSDQKQPDGFSIYIEPFLKGGPYCLIKCISADWKSPSTKRIYCNNQIGISLEINSIDYEHEDCYSQDEYFDEDNKIGGGNFHKYRFYHFNNDVELNYIIEKHIQPFLNLLSRLIQNGPLERLVMSSPNSTKSGQSESTSDSNVSNTKSLNWILYGPPGTGKTYSTIRWALNFIDADSGITPDTDGDITDEQKSRYHDLLWDFNNEQNTDIKRIAFTTFHQSYGYEEFIEGYRPECDQNNNLIYRLKPGSFKAFCDYARNKEGNFVFIIDEINRGNISKIFGELITLIEDDKREETENFQSCILPYSYNRFAVPKNVYILGTMNTADRSLTRLDAALRRRFIFKEMMPKPELLNSIMIQGTDINLEYLLSILNKRILALYDRDHQIGHAYFIKLQQNPTMQALADVMKNRILPLLKEYFYDDWEKIRLVLGDNQKKEEPDFINVEDVDEALFGSKIECNKSYRIDESAFEDPNAYRFLK